MLACRVVLARGLAIEPGEWLDTVDEDELKTWEAYAKLEPWWGQRELLARILSTVRYLLASKFSDEHRDGAMKESFDMAANYMPPDWIGQPDEPGEQSIAQVQAQLEAMFYGNGNQRV